MKSFAGINAEHTSVKFMPSSGGVIHFYSEPRLGNIVIRYLQGPRLLKSIDFNPSMDM